MYNVKVLKFADGKVQVRKYSKNIHKNDDITEKIQEKRLDTISRKNYDDLNSENQFSAVVSKNRTLNSIYYITRSNHWEYFLTLTFDPKKIYSCDYTQVMEYLHKYVKLLKKYAPDLRYIFVPELHSDKKKWHIHGLIADCGKIPFIDSGRVINDCKIYNMPLWEYGFSNASLVKDNSRVCAYVSKYITKDLVLDTRGRNRYVISQNLDKPQEIDLCLSDYEFKKLFVDNLSNLLHSQTKGDSENNISYFEFDDFSLKDGFCDLAENFDWDSLENF